MGSAAPEQGSDGVIERTRPHRRMIVDPLWSYSAFCGHRCAGHTGDYWDGVSPYTPYVGSEYGVAIHACPPVKCSYKGRLRSTIIPGYT